MFKFKVFKDNGCIKVFETKKYKDGCKILEGIEGITKLWVWCDNRLIKQELYETEKRKRKVYVVTSTCDSGYGETRILGVYDSREKAENKIREAHPIESLNVGNAKIKTNSNGTPVFNQYYEYIGIFIDDETGEEYEHGLGSAFEYDIKECEVQ